MHLHCYAVIPNEEDKNWLASKLRHHNLPFKETTSHISVDIEVLSYRTVEKIVSYFEQIETHERGVTVIGNKEEVPYDSG